MSEEAPRPVHRAALWGLPALALLVCVWPWPSAPTRLLGHPAGEASNHLRMLWRAGQRLRGVEGALGNLPEGSSIPLMDPVNLPLYLAGEWAHPAFGYGLVVVGNLALAGLGAAALARALGGGGAATLTAAVAGISAPFLSGVVDFGITEALPAGWLGLHLAAAIRGSEAPGWGAGWRWWLASGLALGAFMLAGWYHAVFAVPVELGLGLWLLGRRRGALPAFIAQGLLASLMVLPRLAQHLAVRSAWEGRWSPPSMPPEGFAEVWRSTPVYGADLLALLEPGSLSAPLWLTRHPELSSPSKVVYLGVVVLVLAALAGRRARLPLALAAPLLVLALGFWLRIAGAPILPELGLPARWLTSALPPLEGLSHWHRAVGPATVLLAAAAGLGAERLSLRWRPLALLLPLLVLLDHVALSRQAWPRFTLDTQPPEAYAAMQGPGGLVQLPFDNDRAEFEVYQAARIYERWQPIHGRAISENYEGPDALLRRSRLIAAADALCGRPFRGPPSWAPPEDMRRPEALGGDAALRTAARQLSEMGVGWVAVHRWDCRPEEASTLLRRALGEPVQAIGGVELYRVPGR
ncbi:MAG: hypothetical protein H6741_23725 [Alphaproteobacteria bacterium]|nr:hypothetical protein [Alphaproteobacteria bacterium]